MNLKQAKNNAVKIKDADKRKKTMNLLRMMAPEVQITDAKGCPYEQLIQDIEALGVSSEDAKIVVDKFKESINVKDSKKTSPKLMKKISDGWHDEDHSDLTAIISEWVSEKYDLDLQEVIDVIEQWPADTAPVQFDYDGEYLYARGDGTKQYKVALGQEPVAVWKEV